MAADNVSISTTFPGPDDRSARLSIESMAAFSQLAGARHHQSIKAGDYGSARGRRGVGGARGGRRHTNRGAEILDPRQGIVKHQTSPMWGKLA